MVAPPSAHPRRKAKGEGEAARNNVVMSAGMRSGCPGMTCHLLSEEAPPTGLWRDALSGERKVYW